MTRATFKLPDLGEGLPDAEIVAWQVAVGEAVQQGEPLLAVETAKAIVDIPSPVSGVVRELYCAAGTIATVGTPLAEFETEQAQAPPSNVDAGTVVGRVESGSGVIRERASPVAASGVGIKAMPAVRALAKRLQVELSMVTPSGPDGVITAEDVKRVAGILAAVGPMEPLRGVRRAMARGMAQAHAEVVPVSLTEDADIDHWPEATDVLLRLIRALVAGCRVEPAVNAWFDSHAMGRRLLTHIDLGIATDTEEGLFVPVLRDVGTRDEADLRRALQAMKRAVRERTVPPEELRGNTITLSNYGTIGGRYATPVVMPPTVAILGAGRIHSAVVAAAGAPAVRRILPLSLTFDHRCVTGAEAARFLNAVVADLQS